MSMTTPWARKFILSRPKDALLPIPRAFIEDGFNLVQLAAVVDRTASADRAGAGTGDGEKRREQQQQSGAGANSLYRAALRLILENGASGATAGVNGSGTPSTGTAATTPAPSPPADQREIQKAAEVLYTLLHARYISSPMGLGTVRRMMSRRRQRGFPPLDGDGDGGAEAIFGKCPRVPCRGMPLLPYGRSDEYDVRGVRKGMKYCCSCGESFYAWESKVDGSAWGPTFCHLFAMTHGAEIFPGLLYNKDTEPKRRQQQQQAATDGGEGEPDEPGARPVPKIFGFGIHPEATIRYPVL